MKIQEREWDECESCGAKKKLKREEVYGCDTCRKPIDLNKTDSEYMEATLFFHNESAHRRQYCSWKCAIKDLKKVKTDYFVSLPYLKFDTTKPGMRAKDFFALLKKL